MKKLLIFVLFLFVLTGCNFETTDKTTEVGTEETEPSIEETTPSKEDSKEPTLEPSKEETIEPTLDIVYEDKLVLHEGAPEVNHRYKLAVNREGKMRYATGYQEDTNYGELTYDFETAADFYIEALEDGYYIALEPVMGSPKYLNFEVKGKYVYMRFEESPLTVFTYNEKLNTSVSYETTTNYSNEIFYIGNYGSKTTLNVSHFHFAEMKDNWVSHFYEVIKVPVENPTPEETPEITPTPEETTTPEVIDPSTPEESTGPVVPGPQPTPCDHTYENNLCTKCHHYYHEEVYKIFGEDLKFYTNYEENPYNIDISSYGSNVIAAFYEPELNGNNPYSGYSFQEFYDTFDEATSYEDAIYRTQGKKKFIAGDQSKQSHLPNELTVKEGKTPVRLTTGAYILDHKGNYIAYIVNDLNNNFDIVYYGAGYTDLDEVLAYIFAFGEVPLNNNYDKNRGRDQSAHEWSLYGRCNVGNFYGDASRYPFQPWMPGNGKENRYTETDFGSVGGYYNGSREQHPYISGTLNKPGKMGREACRICFVDNQKSIDKRHVLYTYNHYNDFQEYLNYNGGFGIRFGNETAGNPYCSSGKEFKPSYKDPTQYELPIFKTLNQVNGR